MNLHVLKRYAVCMLAALSYLWCSAAPARAADPNRLTDIRYWSAPTYTRIVLDLEQEAKFESFTLTNPDRIVVDVIGVAPKVSRELMLINDKIVKQVRAAGSGKDRVRIVIDLDQKSEHTIFSVGAIEPKPPRLVIDISRPDLEEADRTRRTQTRQLIQSGTRIVVVDPGHGGEDPGAVGKGGLHEKNIVLAIARRLVDNLNRQPGIKAYLTRTGDYFIPLAKRVEIAKQYSADLFISMHADASFNTKAAGSSVFCLSFKGATSNAARMAARKENASDFIGGVPLGQPEGDLNNIIFDLLQTHSVNAGLRLGGLVLKELGAVNHLHSSQLQQANFVVLRAPHIPSVLIETDYLSNPSRSQRLIETGFQESFARHVTQAVTAYFKDESVPLQPSVQAQAQPAPVFQPTSAPQQTSRPSYHVVQRGDTLSGLAARYGTSMAELRQLNSMSKTAALQAGRKLKLPGDAASPAVPAVQPAPVSQPTSAPQPTSRPSYHVVQRGDTLSGLAARYGTSMAELRQLNTMSKTATLQAGRKLKLPGDAASPSVPAVQPAPVSQPTSAPQPTSRPSYHVVQRGDTLSGLAARYGISMTELRRLNTMSKTAVLRVGVKLKLM